MKLGLLNVARIGALLGYALLGAKPAHAIIVKHPEDSNRVAIERIERRSFENAKNFAVCAVLVKESLNDVTYLGAGTLIKNRRGEAGFVITAASLVAGKKRESIVLSFRPNFKTDYRKIAIRNVVVHPAFTSDPNSQHNLAILEFDPQQLPTTSLPILLNESAEGDESEQQEGIIVGYGHFGTNKTNLQDLGSIHSGQTFVTLSTDADQNSWFSSKLPLV